MTYGPEVEWCRNVMAAGKAICKWQGQEYILERPEIIPARLALSTYLLPIQLATRMGIVKHCLWLHKPAEGSIK